MLHHSDATLAPRGMQRHIMVLEFDGLGGHVAHLRRTLTAMRGLFAGRLIATKLDRIGRAWRSDLVPPAAAVGARVWPSVEAILSRTRVVCVGNSVWSRIARWVAVLLI